MYNIDYLQRDGISYRNDNPTENAAGHPGRAVVLSQDLYRASNLALSNPLGFGTPPCQLGGTPLFRSPKDGPESAQRGQRAATRNNESAIVKKNEIGTGQRVATCCRYSQTFETPTFVGTSRAHTCTHEVSDSTHRVSDSSSKSVAVVSKVIVAKSSLCVTI